MSRKNGNGRLVDAVGYLRRSTDKQEASIPDQQTAVQRYADERGYRIIRWYIDDAVSGDDTGKRHDFLRMIADAGELRDFQAILCWDGARFGRFDSIEAGYYIFPLRKAGVYLATVMEGVTDWNDSTGRIVGNVKQEGKHQQLIDLSANVTRGQLEAAKNASWIGSPPYAYKIEGPRKHKRLVLGDPGQVCVVQRIFREFVEEGRAMMNIATRLNKDGIVSPSGRVKGWRFDTIRVILRNPAYAGDYAGCRYSYGKYHTIKQGTVAKANGRCSRPESEWVVRRDSHEPIVDRATWEKAQAILDKGKTGRSPYTPEKNPFVLAGLLRCGRCGAPLGGIHSGSHVQNNRRRYYECGNFKRNGKEVCEGTTVREDRILEEIADHLENWLGLEGEVIGTAAYYGALSADDLPEAFARIRKLVAPPTKPKQDRKRLEKQAESLKAQLAKARDNLVLLDPENIPAAQERIRQLDAQRADIELELKKCKPVVEKDVNAVTVEVLNNLYSLAYCCRALAKPQYVDAGGRKGIDNGDGTVTFGSLESVAPQAVKRLLNHASHIVCHTATRGDRRGTRHEFLRGEIVFNGVGPDTSNSNPYPSA